MKARPRDVILWWVKAALVVLIGLVLIAAFIDSDESLVPRDGDEQKVDPPALGD